MFTNYFLNNIAGNVFGTKKTPTLPTSYYLGLSTTTPNLDGTGVTEPSSDNSGYERVKLECLSEPSDGKVESTEVVVFPDSLANWGIITHAVVFDAKNGGNLLIYERLEEPRTVEKNSSMVFRAGEISLTIANEAEAD